MSPDQPTHKADDETGRSEDMLRGETRRIDSNTPQSPSFFEDSEMDFEVVIDSVANQTVASASKFQHKNLPIQFAGYFLTKRVGEGGAGVVFRATPNPDNTKATGFDSVAIKMIRPEMIVSKKTALRFEKESRLHATVASPYITQHLEFGCEKGRYFIASEFIEGVELGKVIEQLKLLPARKSLRVVADVLRALSAMHLAGVIHRDVKPSNIIVRFRKESQGQATNDNQADAIEQFEIAKLTDFGLARHIDQSDSLALTRQRAMLGTPMYMAPEQQYESRTVDARADIYSLGVTLYQMLVGTPPFESDSMTEMAEMHRDERPMPPKYARPGISDAVNNLVMKALEKQPDLRYPNATEMLADVERILNNKPISIRLYPQTPDASHASIRKYDFQWTLEASVKQLWPLVADTDRFNKAIGLPAVKFTHDHSDGQRKTSAEATLHGLVMRWREHPFQWISEREMSVLREFESGPFQWVTSTVELHPLAGQKTRLVHRFEVKPRGWLGKLLTPFQFNFSTKRSLDRVYAQLEKIANDNSCGFACDVSFGAAPKLSKAQKQRLKNRCDALATQINNPRLAQQMADVLTRVADSFAARIRPIPLANQLDCSIDESLELCLASVENGLLNLTWDVVCPVCRVAAQNFTSLTNIESHTNCEVCNLRFKVEFSQSVEAVFRVHQEIRDVESKTYCIGGPFHAPHVIAQNRLLSQQQINVGAGLVAGTYELRGPQLDDLPKIVVQKDAEATRTRVKVGAQNESKLPPTTPIREGDACIQIENQSAIEILIRLEQNVERFDALTADRASKHPLFRKLFPSDLSTFRQLVELSSVHLLVIKFTQADALLDDVGEVAFREMWHRMENTFPLDRPDCQVIARRHDAILVSFERFQDLLKWLLEFNQKEADEIGQPANQCSFAINAGEVMTGHSEGQPDTFGKTVRDTWKLVTDQQGSIAIPSNVFSLFREEQSESVRELTQEFPVDSASLNSGIVRLVCGGGASAAE